MHGRGRARPGGQQVDLDLKPHTDGPGHRVCSRSLSGDRTQADSFGPSNDHERGFIEAVVGYEELDTCGASGPAERIRNRIDG
jgi:hypothetical protein